MSWWGSQRQWGARQIQVPKLLVYNQSFILLLMADCEFLTVWNRYLNRENFSYITQVSSLQNFVVVYRCRGGSGWICDFRFSDFHFGFQSQNFSDPVKHFDHFASIDGRLSYPLSIPPSRSSPPNVHARRWSTMNWVILSDFDFFWMSSC